MNDQETAKLLEAFGFKRDVDPSGLDGYTYAGYTRVDNKGRLIHAHLHKEQSGVVVNMHRFEYATQKLGSFITDLQIDRSLIGIKDASTLESVVKTFTT